MSARITGMTRYVCLKVSGGKVEGPVKEMRFDQSLYEAFGSNLEALINFQEVIRKTMTYNQRHIGGKRVPGMIVKDWNFVG